MSVNGKIVLVRDPRLGTSLNATLPVAALAFLWVNQWIILRGQQATPTEAVPAVWSCICLFCLDFLDLTEEDEGIRKCELDS